MALTPSTQGTTLGVKTPINVKRLAMWKITEGTSSDTYGSVIDFDKRFMSYTDSLSTATAQLYGCGELMDTVTKPTQGALTINVHALKAAERSSILGETVSSDTATLTGAELAPYMVVALAEEVSNGHWNLYKYYKAQFSQAQLGSQQTDTGVTFSTTSLTGTYIKNGRVGKMRDIKFDVDPTTDEGSAAIETWFTTAVPS